MQAKPLIPWPGGKRRLANQIIEALPAHDCYVEPFCGAAAVLLQKAPAKVEVLNDLNGDLINLYRVVKHHPVEFTHQFRWALNSRKMYEWHNVTAPQTLTDIQRAARFFYLQKLAFGARVTGRTFGTATTSKPRLNLMRIEEDISEMHLRLANVYIEHLPWHECALRYDRPHTALFFDPPYWQTAGYGNDFPWSEYERLAEFAVNAKGGIVITLNEHPDIRRLFADFDQKPMQISYTPGGSHRAKMATELLITRPAKKFAARTKPKNGQK